MGSRVDGHGVSVVAGLIVTEEDDPRPIEIEDREIAALGGDVEPAEPRVDGQHVRATTGLPVVIAWSPPRFTRAIRLLPSHAITAL